MSHIASQRQLQPNPRTNGRAASPSVSVISGRSLSTRISESNNPNASPLSLHASSPASPRSFLYPSTANTAPSFHLPVRQRANVPSDSNVLASQAPRSARNITISNLAPLQEAHHRDSTDFFGARSNNSAGQNTDHGQPRPLYRQASLGRQASPLFRTIQRKDSQTGGTSSLQTSSPVRRNLTPISTSDSAPSGTLSSRPSKLSLRMPLPVARSDTRTPFGDSPTSNYTNDESNLVWNSSDSETSRKAAFANTELLTNPHQNDPHRLSPLEEHSVYSHSLSSLADDLDDQPINSRIPLDKRPPRLNMQAVRDAETRGSLTSLPDLIRRATKLASNLDRGKTASRLGLDAFLGTERPGSSRRESTYSDVLFAFPAPGSTLSPRRGQTPISMRPSQGTAARATPVVYEDEKPKAARRCCGMSMTVFLIVLVVLTLLIAAAVLLPIFLILVPAQNPKPGDLRYCAKLHPCNNGGVSVVDDNACSCVCRSGFTGSDCSVAADPSCVTTNIRDGLTSYNSATLGSDVVSLPQIAQTQFNISLNATVLLSLFSKHNFSCSGENSLVRFTTPRSLARRLFILPLQNEQLPDSLREAPVDTRIKSSDNPTLSSSPQTPTTTRSLAQRDSTGMTPQPSSVATSKVTDSQINFARVVVLYVLQLTRVPSVAVNSQLLVQQYLKSDSLTNNRTAVEVVSNGGNTITADFVSFTIREASGVVVGGSRLI